MANGFDLPCETALLTLQHIPFLRYTLFLRFFKNVPYFSRLLRLERCSCVQAVT